MAAEPTTSGIAAWTRAVELDRLQPSRPIAVKLRGTQTERSDGNK